MKDFLDVYSKQIIMHNEKYKELLSKREKLEQKMNLFNHEEEYSDEEYDFMMCSEYN
jgi:hypothetical protein